MDDILQKATESQNAVKSLRKIQLLLLISVSFALGSLSSYGEKWFGLAVFGVIGTYSYFKYSLNREAL